VLDDGTPPKFLDKLQEKYPDIIICRSPFYEAKSQAILDHVNQAAPYNISGIPDGFWYTQIEQGSDFFLLLEDDIWLTATIDLSNVQEIMKAQRMSCVKLYWGGNEKIIQGKKVLRDNLIEQLTDIPFPIKSPRLFRFFISNRFKVFSLAYKLGIWKSSSLLPYYSIYSVAGAFFEKNYWLYLWKTSKGTVNESNQLLQALSYQKMYNVNFGKLRYQSCDTSYITSTSNAFPDIVLDFMQLNYCLNDAWLKERLIATENLPGDFNVSYLEQCLISFNGVDIKAWKNWIAAFKDHYRNLGFNIN
jgi:hypothetical protein